jgi:hypothetical protein
MNVTKDFLLGIRVPEMTETYSPVPHADIIQAVTDKANTLGYTINQETYHSTPDGKRLVGQVTFEMADPDLRFMIAFRNSYDKSMALGFAAGGSVIVCSNGMIASDTGIALKRKHTGDIRDELNVKVHEAFQYLDTNMELLKESMGTMKDCMISKRVASELLGRMVVEEEILNTMQLNIVRNAMEKDPHFKWNGNSTTVWNFYNNITESLKRSHPTSMIQDHVDAHQFITNELHLA